MKNKIDTQKLKELKAFLIFEDPIHNTYSYPEGSFSYYADSDKEFNEDQEDKRIYSILRFNFSHLTALKVIEDSDERRTFKKLPLNRYITCKNDVESLYSTINSLLEELLSEKELESI